MKLSHTVVFQHKRGIHMHSLSTIHIPSIYIMHCAIFICIACLCLVHSLLSNLPVYCIIINYNVPFLPSNIICTTTIHYTLFVQSYARMQYSCSVKGFNITFANTCNPAISLVLDLSLDTLYKLLFRCILVYLFHANYAL